MKHEKYSHDEPFPLLPGERIINTEDVLAPIPERPPSGLRELYRLANARVSATLQEFSPPLASLALESNTEVSSELHKYEALFGRDSLRVALDILPLYPQLTRATLLALAKLQGTGNNAAREEERGRIPHEVRNSDDPIALELTNERGWGWPYYGTVDATPQFVHTIAAYCKQAPEGTDLLLQGYTDKDDQPASMEIALTEAVDWILRRMHSNKEGLLEYKAAIPKGIENQVWKDSWDAYFHKDGTLANHEKGIASIEVQRLAYDALLDAAELYDDPIIAQPMYAEELRANAEHLRDAIFRYFWTEDQGGYFVLGTDRNHDDSLNQLEVRTSNMGHVLNSRLLEGNDPALVHMREMVVHQLFSPEMLAAGGIRTLASDEVRFRPGAYHNGSVWLWDTNATNRGLRRHSYLELSDVLGGRLLSVVETTKSFPEFVRGDTLPTINLNTKIIDVWDETNQRVNRIEQPPQQIQAWSVGTALDIKHSNRLRHGQIHIPSAFEQSIIENLN